MSEPFSLSYLTSLIALLLCACTISTSQTVLSMAFQPIHIVVMEVAPDSESEHSELSQLLHKKRNIYDKSKQTSRPREHTLDVVILNVRCYSKTSELD